MSFDQDLDLPSERESDSQLKWAVNRYKRYAFDNFRNLTIDEAKILFGFLINQRSKHTIIAYKTDLLLFFDFLRKKVLETPLLSIADFQKVGSFEVLALKKMLEAKGYKDRTINRKLNAISSFYAYLIEQKVTKENPVNSVKRCMVDFSEIETRGLTNEQVKSILSEIKEDSLTGLLHKAVLTTLFYTGMRNSELTGLKISSLSLINDKICFTFIAKGNKKRIIPLHIENITVIKKYLKTALELGYSADDEDYLFRPTKNNRSTKGEGERLNKRLHAQSIRNIVSKYTKSLDLEKITPHSARATVISHLLEKGLSIDEVADLVGHKSLAQTRSYNKRRVRLQNPTTHKIEYDSHEL